MRLNKKDELMKLESKLDDFIVKFSGRRLIYEYLILTPCHLLVLGTFNVAENKISVEMQETFLNICPAIVNAVTGLANSVGTLMEVINGIIKLTRGFYGIFIFLRIS